MSIARLIAQVLVCSAVGGVLILFSRGPDYGNVAPGSAVVRFALAHGGQRLENCRERTAEELSALAPNMRKKAVCDRRRAPVHVRLKIDGTLAIDIEIPPGGIAGDGPARLRRTFVVDAGRREVEVGLSDSGRSTGFDYVTARTIDLAAGQSVAIDFSAAAGGFVIE